MSAKPLNREEWLAACGNLAKVYEEGWEEADKLVQQGAAEERAKIVAWLRSEARDCVWATDSETAEAIEAGEHLK